MEMFMFRACHAVSLFFKGPLVQKISCSLGRWYEALNILVNPHRFSYSNRERKTSTDRALHALDHGFIISLRPTSIVLLVNSKECFYKYSDNLVISLCWNVMLVFNLSVCVYCDHRQGIELDCACPQYFLPLFNFWVSLSISFPFTDFNKKIWICSASNVV